MRELQLGDATIHYQVHGNATPSVVMLHDGLGSIGQWRGLPKDLAQRTGKTVLAYNRSGHGVSLPVPRGPWPADWLHHEAELLRQLLDRLDLSAPALIGHSDGGSIALIFAGEHPERLSSLTVLAAHSYVEEACVEEISAMRSHPDRLLQGLGRVHAKPAELFEAWSGVWVSEEFGEWDIRPLLARIIAPALVIQGERDEYGTDAMALETAAAIGGNATCVLLPDVGHLLHHEAPDAILDLVGDHL